MKQGDVIGSPVQRGRNQNRFESLIMILTILINYTIRVVVYFYGRVWQVTPGLCFMNPYIVVTTETISCIAAIFAFNIGRTTTSEGVGK
jgi:hypothetical protein